MKDHMVRIWRDEDKNPSGGETKRILFVLRGCHRLPKKAWERNTPNKISKLINIMPRRPYSLLTIQFLIRLPIFVRIKICSLPNRGDIHGNCR